MVPALGCPPTASSAQTFQSTQTASLSALLRLSAASSGLSRRSGGSPCWCCRPGSADTGCSLRPHRAQCAPSAGQCPPSRLRCCGRCRCTRGKQSAVRSGARRTDRFGEQGQILLVVAGSHHKKGGAALPAAFSAECPPAAAYPAASCQQSSQ